MNGMMRKRIFKPTTSDIKDSFGKNIRNSISEIHKITIGGVSQYIMMRGNDIRKPVLLFIHGGPGQAEIGYIRQYQKELEEHFVVVRWDQRGAGLSASKCIPNETLTINTILSDLDEITDYLIKKFNQLKIFIAGHSWGTVLATKAVMNNPNKYFAYVGIAQLVDSYESEKIAYAYTKSEAIKQNIKKVIKKLDRIGEPPYSIDEVLIRVECIGLVGGIIKTNPKRSLGSSLLLSREYDLLTKLNYQKNCMNCVMQMWEEISKVNFLNNIGKIEIPVIFIMGRYDYITPTELVEEFYERLDAPKKTLIIFEDSGHLPQLEENDKFNKMIIKMLSELMTG